MLATARANPPNILPLGDSITYVSPVAGGYREPLQEHLQTAGNVFQVRGKQNANATPALIAAGQANHEGHNGYRVEEIAANLNADDGSPDSNGGFWLQRAPAPDILLLLIGANDILQNYQTATLAER